MVLLKSLLQVLRPLILFSEFYLMFFPSTIYQIYTIPSEKPITIRLTNKTGR